MPVVTGAVVSLPAAEDHTKVSSGGFIKRIEYLLGEATPKPVVVLFCAKVPNAPPAPAVVLEPKTPPPVVPVAGVEPKVPPPLPKPEEPVPPKAPKPVAGLGAPNADVLAVGCGGFWPNVPAKNVIQP